MKRFALALAAAFALAPALAQAAVTVKGSDTMVILSQRWAENYMKKHADLKVQVTGGGSGTGIAALINGTTDAANSSREMKGEEKAKIKDKYSVDAVEIVVARDGVGLYAHESNGVSQLTMEQVKKIFMGDVTNWKDVGGADAPIVLYSRENSSGTYVFFKEHVLKNGDFAAAAQTLPGTAAVVNAISKEKNGIGYGGAAYAKGVKEIKVVGADGQAYAPTEENVRSGKYALARPLFVYTRGAPAGETKSFIDYCLSPEGQAIVKDVGYYTVK